MNNKANNKSVSIWANTLENKTNSLRNGFGVTFVIGMFSLVFVLALSKYNSSDIIPVLLLMYSLIGSVPYIEVATSKNESNILFQRRLTIVNYKNELKRGNFDILSSNTHFLQPMFPMLTSVSFLLFAVYKIAGEEYVTYNTVLFFLIMQIPFNHALGLNPLGAFISRQSVSKHVTQQNLVNFFNKSKQNQVTYNNTTSTTSNRKFNNRQLNNRSKDNSLYKNTFTNTANARTNGAYTPAKY